MQEEKAGIAFQETMQGPFALRATDPQAGVERGKAAKTELSITCAITIRDLDRFLRDPEHTGEIAGHISFAPFGEDIPAKRGIFNLFSPAQDPTTKLMVYELAFTHDGQDYYLAGRKEVREGPVYDVWHDTTTLYTKLHQGVDTTGPVIGAGIITIDLERLLKMVASMHTIHTHSSVEQASILLKFGRFFLGELWETYGRK